ncbi:AraC family transcriptional regulator [Clostridium manihotivorum]|uniref:AraC family transcriptional regulator n=1 Tax=Clostridium manihotivorum TaxID=2320868 RepID=A0A3R5QVY6_9CLOT|nr:AraC family transcriptional regulator [Clostridium manihotivorum]QAA33523.1 AraC family transcriptional regulator [Clostridium manihotivorum]
MIKVNIGGCNNHHPQNFVVRHVEGSKDYLLIITKTETSFSIDGEKYETPPGTMVLFDKNVPSNYGNNSGEYINDWLHFDFEGEEPPFDKLKIVLNKPVILNDITSLALILNLIITEMHSKSTYKEDVLDHYVKILLYRLSEQIHNKNDSIKSHPLYQKLVELRTKIYNNPQEKWTIDRMCRELKASASYVQHVYKHTFQTSCMKDVINARIEQAKFYLLQSVLCISSIAENCGYDSEIHFSRQFKQFTGMSPREYRENMIARKEQNS